MADEHTAVNASASPESVQQGDQGASQVSGAGVQPEYMTVEQVNALIAPMQERMQQQSALIGKLQNTVSKGNERVNVPTPPAAGDDTGSDSLRKPDALDKRLEDIQRHNDALRQQTRRLSLSAALNASGVNASDIDDARIVFEARHEQSLNTDELGNVVSVGDTTLQEYVKVWLSGDGRRYLPAKPNPSTGGAPTVSVASGNVPTASLDDLRHGRVSNADVSAGKVRIVANPQG